MEDGAVLVGRVETPGDDWIDCEKERKEECRFES